MDAPSGDADNNHDNQNNPLSSQQPRIPPLTRAGDAEIWARVVKRRRLDCASLSAATTTTATTISSSSSSIPDDPEEWLQAQLQVMANPNLPPQARRFAWRDVQEFFDKVDEKLGRLKENNNAHDDQEQEKVTTKHRDRAYNALEHVDLSITSPLASRKPAATIAVPSAASLSAETTTATSTANVAATAPQHEALLQHNKQPLQEMPPGVNHIPTNDNSTTAKSKTATRRIHPSLASLTAASSRTMDQSAEAANAMVANIHPALAKLNGNNASTTTSSAIHPALANLGNLTGHTTSTSDKAILPRHPALAALVPPPAYERHSATTEARRKEKDIRQAAAEPVANGIRPIHPSLVGTNLDPSKAAVAPSVVPPPSLNKSATDHNKNTKEPVDDLSSDDEPIANLLKQANAKQTPTVNATTMVDDKTTPIPFPHPPKKTVVEIPKPEISQQTDVVTFRSDRGPMVPYSGACEARLSSVKALFRKHIPSEELLSDVGSRFRHWDPFWQVQMVVACGLTSPIDKLEWSDAREKMHRSPPTMLRTAASFTIGDMPGRLGKFKDEIQWGRELPPPQNGDCRLIFRMLPLARSDKVKKKRADCHLWPKGTLLMLNGSTPLTISQRRQQSHDFSEWKGMSKWLDLGLMLNKSTIRQHFDVGCYDTEQFVYSIMVCTYHSSPSLRTELLAPTCKYFQRLNLEHSMQKALSMIQVSMVIDDDDGDTPMEDANDDMGKFVFSLVCPISKQPMKDPVRGIYCKHFQCFDLEKFLSCNEPVSGIRWRCASCENFVSHQELQYCALTKAALDKFGSDVTATRDRVEFRADKSYVLLPPAKLKYANRRNRQNAAANSGKQPNEVGSSMNGRDTQNEIVELVDSD